MPISNPEELLDFLRSPDHSSDFREAIEYIQNTNDDLNYQDRGKTALMEVAKIGNIQILELLIAKGVNLNLLDNVGRTALMYADQNNGVGIVTSLINNGADINIRDEYDCNILMLNVERNNVEVVKVLLENGYDINTRDNLGNTVLMLAISDSANEVAKLLIERGADVNATNRFNKKALDIAVREENRELSELLGGRVVTVDKRFNQSKFIEMNSELLNNKGVCYGFNIEMTRWVMKHIAQGEAENEIDVIAKLNRILKKENPINFLSRVSLYQTEQDDNKSMVKKQNIEYIKNNFFDSLSETMKNKKFIGMSFATFNKEQQQDGGHTISIRRIGDSESYEVIDVNKGSRKCNSKEELNNHIEDILYYYQKDVPLQRSRWLSVYDLEAIVKERNWVSEPILEDDSPDVVLQKKETNKSKKYKLVDGAKDQSLFLAVSSDSSKEFINHLIDRKADINYQDNYGITALMLAARRGDKEMAELLLDKGANVNLQSSYGNTALMNAVSEGNKEMVALLVDANANLNLQNQYGNTALMIVARRGDKETAELLIAKGANLNLQEKDGKTALDYARDNGNNELVNLLASRIAFSNAMSFITGKVENIPGDNLPPAPSASHGVLQPSPLPSPKGSKVR